MLGLLLAFFLVSVAPLVGQSYPPDYPYLLRLDHYTFEEHTCALLRNTGAFHLEIDHGEKVKVLEGSIDSSKVLEIQRDLNGEPLASLSQQQIEEPLLRSGRYDKLQVTIFRGDGWRDLFFRSSDSQRAYKPSLQSLVNWLDSLHRLPHRELSEDAGKNNCLPRSPIVLQKRGAKPQQEVTAKTRADVLPSNATPQVSQPASPGPARNVSLFRFHSLEIKNGNARDRCVLVQESGTYRFEERIQKGGKPIDTTVFAGWLNADELRQLRQILDDPRLVKMKHREARGGRFVPMLGDMLELSISRPQGNQQFVLSSAFNRPGFPAFYGGDGDLNNAEPLVKFLSDHVENAGAKRFKNDTRNGCTAAP